MENPKFTPGPWEVRNNNEEDRPLEVADYSIESPTWVVAEVYSDFSERSESLANAHIIAAAPDMYAVLQRVAEHFEGTDAPLGIDAAAAIAKAEGRAQ